MSVRISNTSTRAKEELLPPAAGKPFGMYCCGPTVYGPAHIGNFRTFLVQDVLRRTLECAGVNVRHVRNITDVDDKTIRESRKLGMSLKEFTSRWEEKFHRDCEALNMLSPCVEPRATEHIGEQISMIASLVEKGHAYVAPDGSVYFKISSFPEYGRLSGLDREGLSTQSVNSAGEANAADEYERDNVADFALWKARKPEDGENYWESPWGEGRPGWHIECSAMSRKYLGDTFELHGGGVDLCFPHHENEIAQSRCATGAEPAKFWFHSAHLMVDGAKMSKSLGNLYTLDDLLSRGYSPMQVRYALIAGHYRQQLNFTFKSLDDAGSALAKLRKFAVSALDKAGMSEADFKKLVRPGAKFEGTLFASAWEALCDDINTPRALGETFSAASKMAASGRPEDIAAFGSLMYALGIDPFAAEGESGGGADAPSEVVELARRRWEAKKSRDFALADELRKRISEAGWIVLDGKDGFELKKA